jgi:hypothetical protein
MQTLQRELNIILHFSNGILSVKEDIKLTLLYCKIQALYKDNTTVVFSTL